MQTAERSFILAVDNFAGRDDAVIKALDDFRPRGVAGVTTLSNGQIVLILDMKELLADLAARIPTVTCGIRRRGLWSSSPRTPRSSWARGLTAPIFLRL
jgi:chemotaxis protein histidine kinase CheA